MAFEYPSRLMLFPQSTWFHADTFHSKSLCSILMREWKEPDKNLVMAKFEGCLEAWDSTIVCALNLCHLRSFSFFLKIVLKDEISKLIIYLSHRCSEWNLSNKVDHKSTGKRGIKWDEIFNDGSILECNKSSKRHRTFDFKRLQCGQREHNKQ